MAYGDEARTEDDLKVYDYAVKTADEQELEAFEKNVKAVFEDMAEILVRKRQSYGNSNLLEDGGYGVVIRIHDKLGRLRTMYRSGTYANADGDSMMDAWRDIIGYATLAILMELDEIGKKASERHGPAEYFATLDAAKQADKDAGPFRIELKGEVNSSPMEFETADAEGVKYLIGNPIRSGPNSIDVEIKLDEVNIEAIKQMVGEPYVRSDDIRFPLPDDGEIITVYQCLQCGRKTLDMDKMPFDCHPFCREFIVEVV